MKIARKNVAHTSLSKLKVMLKKNVSSAVM